MYVACRDQHGPRLLSTIHDTQDCGPSWCHKACLQQRDIRVVVRLSLTCDARSIAYTSRQKVSARGESAVHASSPETARQAPAMYIFTEELLDKYPPLAHMGIDEEDFAELRMELLGQKMGGRLPSQEQLKNYECVEQYMMYNTYVGWQQQLIIGVSLNLNCVCENHSATCLLAFLPACRHCNSTFCPEKAFGLASLAESCLMKECAGRRNLCVCYSALCSLCSTDQ